MICKVYFLNNFRRTLEVQIPIENFQKVSKIVKKANDEHGGNINIEISNLFEKRTTGFKSQNHHINGHIQQICIETGNKFEDVKEYCKREAIEMGYPMLLNDNGDIVYSLLDKKPLGASEATISSAQATILIEAIHILAAELNIILKEE